MPSVCRFELNKQNATYFSGETITGTIILSTTSDKSVRDISILFVGEGKIKWEESHSTTNRDGSTTTYYRSHESYINNCTLVHGEGNLPAGTHTYTFAIPLPWECPTSCEGRYGHIRYEISLKINRFYRFDNVFKQPVTIIKTIDLNVIPSYKMPITCKEIIRLCCWPCVSGKIHITMKIPFAAYAPGQRVNYCLNIVNQSMSDTAGYSYEFSKKLTFTATSPHRKQRHSKEILVANRFNAKCLRLTNRILEGAFAIPSTPPTTEPNNIIYVEYTLKIKVHISGCYSDCKLKVPIIIGTIPIRESLAETQYVAIQPVEHVLPTAPELSEQRNESMDQDLPPSYAGLKPPSFEETKHSSSPFIDTDVQEKNRIVGFKPLYPMYN